MCSGVWRCVVGCGGGVVVMSSVWNTLRCDYLIWNAGTLIKKMSNQGYIILVMPVFINT